MNLLARRWMMKELTISENKTSMIDLFIEVLPERNRSLTVTKTQDFNPQ
jgi:hypothetical protein